jgi:TetR/AcrR family transcriptional regulator
VRTALELFGQRGFRGTTTRELAAAVGVSEPVLYQHFATKRDLYTAIVEHMLEEAVSSFAPAFEMLDETGDDRQFFQGLGEIFLDWYVARPNDIRLLLFSALESHEFSEIWHQQATLKLRTVLESHVEARVASRVFRELTPQVAARAFLGMISNYGMALTVFEHPVPGLRREEVVAQFVDIFLNGIRRRGAAGDTQS